MVRLGGPGYTSGATAETDVIATNGAGSAGDAGGAPATGTVLLLDDQKFLTQVRESARLAVTELIAVSGLQANEILVVGCSTSEVIGQRIGSAGSAAVAAALFEPLWQECQARDIHLACQCCEHLNRALVTSAACMESYRLERVGVVPTRRAGGAFAARAYRQMPGAVVVEEVRAHAGLDLGETLIGMHLRRVAVPVRLTARAIGQARVTAARTRPKLIGGERAVYTLDAEG